MRAKLATQSDHEDPIESAPESQRRTFDVGAIASIAGLHDTDGHVPLSRCVAVRTAAPWPEKVSREETRVLLRIDGHTALAEIADETEIPLVEVVAIFLCLLQQGVVEVPWQAPQSSQVVTRNE